MSRDRIEKFTDHIARDWTWRQRELISHNLLFASADDHQEAVLARVGVLLLYSHWEGFLTSTVKEYLKIFSGCIMKETPSHIQSAIFLQHLISSQMTVVNYTLASLAVSTISKSELTASSTIHKIVGAKSNLNVDILKNFMNMVNGSCDFFELRENFIDKEFVGIRNAIAHGEYRKISKDDYEDIKTIVIDIIDKFKEIVITSAQSCFLSNE